MRGLLFLLSLTLLGGCALSPQTIEVRPEPRVPAANVGNNSPVAVRVVDAREQEAFGTRGGIYKDTALIRPGNDLSATIKQIVKSSLQKQGFNAYNPPADATRLEVRLETLSYVPESGSVVNRVITKAVIRAVARREQVTHEGNFKSEVEHDLPVTPSAKRNQRMITDTLQRSLERMLADAELLAFLAGEDDPGAAQPLSPAGAEDNSTARPEPTEAPSSEAPAR